MKIGILGGSFDPVHKGHIILAEKVLSYFLLDKLIFVPSKLPPHKLSHASPTDRLAMLEIAISDLDDRFSVSNCEINSKGVSYTYDTLKYFNNKYDGDDIYFIAGSDIFSTIESWKNCSLLFELTKFIVVSRAGVSFDTMLRRIGKDLSQITVKDKDYLEGKDAGIILFETEIPEISSTKIRENIDDAEGLVPANVLSYIKENKLYKKEEQ